jgi:uncharacterized protein
VNAAFADTSFYLALLDERDALHQRALVEAKIDRPILTTEFIVLELGNACGRAEDHVDFLALLAGMRASRRTTIIPLDSAMLQRGLDLFASRHDKDWSLTDCTSFTLMQERRVFLALSSDHHFEQAGFQPLLV